MHSLKHNFFAYSQQVVQALRCFVYPPHCLHCGETDIDPEALFCSECLKLLELIDPSERCPFCFSEDYTVESKVCTECYRRPPALNRIGAAFDYEGPATSLIKAMKYGNQPYIARGCAAFMVAQWVKMEWPMPDCIIPVPIPFVRWLQRGYNQSELLACSFGEMIGCPVEKIIGRKSGDFSQAGMNRVQRTALQSENFFLKKRGIVGAGLKKRGVVGAGHRDLEDKTILLIDDVMTTGSTLRCCAEVLMEVSPAQIYGMTVCRAM